MFCTTADSHGPSVHVLEAIIIPLFRNTLNFVLTSKGKVLFRLNPGLMLNSDIIF